MRLTTPVLCAAAAGIWISGAMAQTDQDGPNIRQVSTHMGEMEVQVGSDDLTVNDKLRFEPYQQIEDMFFRNDVVYVMRHGPTDWSKLDKKGVESTDCANQRVMSPEGAQNMRDLGTLMASNDVLPSMIVVSEWCRNQQTLDHYLEGVARVDPALAEIPVETDGGVNLLLSLNGAKNVTGLRERISNWEGHPDRKGPLLIITHYTNIEELTQFRVFEGESLILDPKRDNQVLGYLRLVSAGPDVGHFADTLSSPLLDRDQALDMVGRYYSALNVGDAKMILDLLSDRWVGHGLSPVLPKQDAGDFLDTLALYTEGLKGASFEIDDIHVADDVVTVLGTIVGIHAGEIFGIEPTWRNVAFGGIAVHRVEEGQIAESWQMVDRLSLIEQISE